MGIDAPETSADVREQLLAVLDRVWGYREFRPLQERAMAAVLSRRDSLVILPTGGGKSICFQAPALLREGVALVVSPLISLMRDQVAQLRQNGIEAGSLHSGQPQEERAEVARSLRAGRLRLLYVSPERLALEDIESLLLGAPLSFIAIDEAHCISMWGHDFRPEYRQLARLRELHPGTDLHAYTATATPRVADDIVQQLSLRAPELLRGSFDRPNLYYSAKPRKDGYDRLLEVVRRHTRESGIVYCIGRKEVEKIADRLRADGYSAAPYHAGLDAETRRRNQDDFIADRVSIIVGTTAFGMGINKPDVRFVVHLSMPKSLENYQQEAGRAGRDGLPAECLMLYSFGDVFTWERMSAEAPRELQRAARAQLDLIHDWCGITSCRRTALLRHFSERYPLANCGACDNCTGGNPALPDSVEIAQMVLSCMVRLKQHATAATVVDVLAGSKSPAITEAGHDQLSTFGLLKKRPRTAVADWLAQLLDKGLAAAGEDGVLAPTEAGWEVLRKRAPVMLIDRLGASTVAPKVAASDELSPGEQAVFEALRALRSSIAKEKRVAPFMVFGDVTLRELARQRPGSPAEFRACKGVGDKKAAELAQPFLAAIRASRARADAESGAPPPPPPSAPAPKKPGGEVAALRRRAFDCLAKGWGVEEIAADMERAPSTIAGYLVEHFEEEGLTDATPYVPAELAARIEAAAIGSEDGRLAPIHEALGGAASYLQIRLVLGCARRRSGG
ncbi:MAG: DNA helicase RecQ [Candidatus Sumerlaeia bacterium]|nr:DNA helicase RecQ [Candidatus Sumerlaeia bacterium]